MYMNIYIASMAENEEREVCDVTKEKDELQPVGDMNMATLMEDVNSESGSQNGLQGVDVDDPFNEKEGTMVTLERHSTTKNRFHNGNC